jgi:hypothetical protein
MLHRRFALPKNVFSDLVSSIDYEAQAAGLLLALCHSRACQQQALRDPRSILVGEW